MAIITVSDLHPTGSELFSDSENYLKDLDDSEFNHLQGGFSLLIYAGVLALESSAGCAAGAAAVSGAALGWYTAGKW